MKIKKFFSYLFIFLILYAANLFGWIYPEHRTIALLAIQKLTQAQYLKLNELWKEARTGYEYRLTEDVIDSLQGINTKLIDFAAWPAIGGDHSCSGRDMLSNILHTDWILDVANITAKLKIELYEARNNAERINALRNSDILLQRADPEYATRAGTNNVHFLLALNDINSNLVSYLNKCNKDGTELNAVAAYTWYHYSALTKISKISTEKFEGKEKSYLILSALADEAFGIHFLEDMFAAGHVAGTWGDASQRKGTHDYYNEKGLRTSTWEGENIIITGDAYMRNEDAQRASEVIKLSLEQFIDAANSKLNFLINTDTTTIRPDGFNVCKTNFLQKRDLDPNFIPLLKNVISKTPVPGLTSGIGELPRFRAELGLFAGFAPKVDGAMISNGWTKYQKTVGLVGGIEATVRIGFGLDGVLNESGDGLIFLEAGYKQDATSSTSIVNAKELLSYGNLLAAVPSRSAYNFRLRLPFYLIPGDLLAAAPILGIILPQTFTKMVVIAANGGLLPWQSGMETFLGRFQFVLGREVGVSFYGRTRTRDAIIYLTVPDNEIQTNFISYRSTQIELPIIEYRPFRSFATDQSSTLLFQLYGGVDIPDNIDVLEPKTIPTPNLQNIWFLGLRMIFDWRHYF